MAAAPAGAGIVWQTPANPPEPHDYIFRSGRRYVRPYYFEFISHVKNRWAEKTIVDLFTEEFKGRPREYYVRAVKCGRLQVDGQMVHADYIVKSSQKISHFLHRHEPPVLGGDISILQNEVDVVTVCKPASVPVHPCGQYRKNTVVGILQAEHGLTPLFPVHRLDRLVSGLLIFTKNADRAERFRQEIEAGLLQKEYVAKVVGLFPDGEQIVDANVNFNAREGRSTVEVCDGSGKTPSGKKACTKFQRICTDGTHSIVMCKPVTGRTHQKTKKQTAIFRSSVEAELRAMAAVTIDVTWLTIDVIWLRWLLAGFGVVVMRPTTLLSDSTGAINIARNPMKHELTKHIGVDASYTRSQVQEGVLALQFVPSELQIADFFMKSQTRIRVHLKHIGYPIANDELYLSENVSPRSSKGASLNRATSLACSLPSSDPDSSADLGSKDAKEADEEFGIDPMCTNCPNLAPVGYDGDEEGLWLHCARYTGPDWSYECPYPDWAFLDNVSRKKMKS